MPIAAPTCADFTGGVHPIYYLQRHALELGLKLCLRVVYAYKDAAADSVTCDSIDRSMRVRLSRCHDVMTLSSDLLRVLAPEERSVTEVVRLTEFAREMAQIDNKSTRVRYGDQTTTVLHRIGRVTLSCRRFQDEIVWLNEHMFDPVRSTDGLVATYLVELDALQAADPSLDDVS